jgi:hypothetical protein
LGGEYRATVFHFGFMHASAGPFVTKVARYSVIPTMGKGEAAHISGRRICGSELAREEACAVTPHLIYAAAD